MGRDLDLDDVVAQYPEAKRELEQLRDDLAAAHQATNLWRERYERAEADLAAARWAWRML